MFSCPFNLRFEGFNFRVSEDFSNRISLLYGAAQCTAVARYAGALSDEKGTQQAFSKYSSCLCD